MSTNSILVVDDDVQLRQLVQLTLQSAGYKVACAPDGRVAIRAMADGSYDLVITDLLMPERDGLELIEEVRRRYSNVRIIAMSGGGRIARDSYLRIAKNFGAHLLLEKPFNQSSVLAAVESVLTMP